MYFEECVKKEIFGSLERSKLPPNINDYSCELFIEEYAEGPISEEVRYLRFTPRARGNAEPFTITIDTITSPTNLIYPYRIIEDPNDHESVQVSIGNKVEFKLQTTIVRPPQPESNLLNLPEPDSEGYCAFHDDIDEDMLKPSFQLVNTNKPDPKEPVEQKQPSQEDLKNMKTELIKFLLVQENKKIKPKEMKTYLMTLGIDVSENKIKVVINQICNTNVSDKKLGYELKDLFVQQYLLQLQQEEARRNPTKKVKEN